MNLGITVEIFLPNGRRISLPRSGVPPKERPPKVPGDFKELMFEQIEATKRMRGGVPDGA